jgi:hypothetical protein
VQQRRALRRARQNWKTTTSRLSGEPGGIAGYGPQLICYSWMPGIAEVTLVIFVPKHQPEIQYLRTTIPEKQRLEFGHFVGATIGQIEGAQFSAHSCIRFPQDSCVRCAHLGLCLDNQKLSDSSLIRTAGAKDLAWLDELVN